MDIFDPSFPTWHTALCESPEIWTGQNRPPIFYGKRIKILPGCPLEGWPNRVWPMANSANFCQTWWDGLPLSALKRMPVLDINSIVWKLTFLGHFWDMFGHVWPPSLSLLGHFLDLFGVYLDMFNPPKDNYVIYGCYLVYFLGIVDVNECFQSRGTYQKVNFEILITKYIFAAKQEKFNWNYVVFSMSVQIIRMVENWNAFQL